MEEIIDLVAVITKMLHHLGAAEGLKFGSNMKLTLYNCEDDGS